MATYRLENLDCAFCAAELESSLKKLDCVRSVSIDFGTMSMKIEADDMKAVAAAIAAAEPDVRVAGLDADAAPDGAGKPAAPKEGAQVRFGSYSLPLVRVLVFAAAFVLGGVGLFLENVLGEGPERYWALLPFVAAYALAGAPVLAAAARNLARGKALDENFLMSIATIGAFAVGEWEEAVGVMLFYMIGELAQEAAVLRSRRSIDALLALRPDTARVADGAGWRETSAASVPVGAQFLVKPGERVPLDGVVLEGRGSLDLSMLTGESLPRAVGPGSEVLSGTLSVDGALVVRSTKVAGESSAARIVELVENASHAKAKTERFITAFARWYTPAVVAAAVLIAAVPPLFVPGQAFGDWLYRALIMLVISCPCALVVSVPLGYFGGIGGLSRRGVLVKGATYIDALAKARKVVFDKTGTLTRGVFSVVDVRPAAGFSRDDLLRIAAAAESRSNHPVAKAIRDAAPAPAPAEPTELIEAAGKGVRAVVGERRVAVGTAKFLDELGVPVEPSPGSAVGGTFAHVAVDGRYAGSIEAGDSLKPTARAAVARLRGLGMGTVSMLTGDSAEAAAPVAASLGLTSFHAGLLPGDKLDRLEAAAAEGPGGTVFVGDGINDAPVLARADVGIAMGSGADAAVEAADAVIMSGDPERVADAIESARRTRRIVRENVVFALGFKLVFLTLGALGLANMWEAVLADVGVALIAVLNSSRALGPGPAARRRKAA